MRAAGSAVVPTAPSGSRTQPGVPLTIDAVQATPKTLALDNRASLELRYRLSAPAVVELAFIDDWGKAVRRLMLGQQAVGMQAMRWDGRDDGGAAVASGVYRYRITAKAPDDRLAEYAPDRDARGEEILARRFTFDSRRGRFTFVLPQIARARLRIGLREAPHLRTVLDWEPMEAGEHEVAWDGLDASGQIRLSEHPDLAVNLSAFSLPPNAVMIRNPGRPEPRAGASGHRPVRRPSPAAGDGPSAYLHARHDRAVCHEPRVAVELPETLGTDASGLPIIGGRVPVRVSVDPVDKDYVVSQRFEVMFFNDTVFLFEAEEGSSPLTFIWDTRAITPGTHLLSVNLLTYDDHVGVMTLPVVIRSERDANQGA